MQNLKKRLWGALYRFIFRPLYTLENTALFWKFINRRGVRDFKKYAEPLTPLEERIVSDLRRDGIATTSLEELFGDKEILPKLVAAAYEEGKGKISPIKPFITEFFDSSDTYGMDNPYLSVVLSKSVVMIVGTYLGMIPRLYEFRAEEINSVGSDAQKIGSMRWHRDPHDRHLCKVFIYLSDVGPKNGPFTYLKHSTVSNKYGKIFPQKPPSGIYPPAEELEKRIEKKDLFPATGKAGSVIFADTSGFHRGGFVEENMRRMFTAGFIPQKSFFIRQTRFNPQSMNALQKKITTGSEYLFSRSMYTKGMKALLGTVPPWLIGKGTMM